MQINLRHSNAFLTLLFPSLLVMTLAGCQSLPQVEPDTKPANQPEKKADIHEPSGVIITPYDHPEIKRQRIIIPEQKTQVQKFDDGRDLPAFKKLIQNTQTAYTNGKWNEAEAAATQAQRLAPNLPKHFYI